MTDFVISEYVPTVMPDVYDAVLTNIETIPPKGQNTEYRRWTFSLMDGRTVPGTTSMQTTPGSKAGKWAAALNGGRSLSIGERPQLIGQPCKILVELNDNGYERVGNVLPRAASAPHVVPASETIEKATDKAQQQHAIQEGDVDPTEGLPF